jgi:cell division septum initiation protein DivIVA
MIEERAPAPVQREKTLDILKMLEHLHETVVDKPRRIVSRQLLWGLDPDEASMQIAKIRASLPTELKQAVTVTRESERIVESAREDASLTIESAKRESERIVSDARREAERLVEQARIQQQQMISESEILKLTKAQCEEIRNAAEREASQLKRGAEKYAFDVLTQLENVAAKVMTNIDRGKAELGRADAAAQPGRERARV